MLPSFPYIDYVNNATEKNKRRNEREANLNSISNSVSPRFTLPAPTNTSKYPNGVYDINNNVIIQKRKPGRPSTKVSKPRSRKINRSLNDQTVIRFIDEHMQGAPVSSLSVKYGISQSTGFKLVADFHQRRGYPFRAARGGAQNKKITSEDCEFFSELLSNNPLITSAQIKEKLKEHNGKDLSVSTINKCIKTKMTEFGLPNFTIKKCVYVENRRNSEEILEKRIKYINIYRECLRQGKDFIFIDETPFNTVGFNNSGRAPAGMPCRIFKNFTRFKNITAITAIHRTFGIVMVSFVEGPVDQFVFLNFLEHLFSIMNDLKICPIYVMDNVRFHKTNRIQEAFQMTSNTCLLTAPWSCELNPIEYIFGIWKRRIKIPRNAQLTEIKKVIADGLLSITREEVSKTIYFVETILFQFALQRKNLVLHNNQHFFHNEYLNVGGDESKFLNYDPGVIIEDSNEQRTIEDNEENILCSFPLNMDSLDNIVSEQQQQQNDTMYIQTSNESNPFLNSPPLQNNSIDNSSECKQYSSINDNNDQILFGNECSSHIDLNERNFRSFSTADIPRSFDNEYPNHDNDILSDNDLNLRKNRPLNSKKDNVKSFHSFNESISQSSDLDQENNEFYVNFDLMADNIPKTTQNCSSSTELNYIQGNNAIVDNLSKTTQNCSSSTELNYIQGNNAIMIDNIPKTTQNCSSSTELNYIQGNNAIVDNLSKTTQNCSFSTELNYIQGNNAIMIDNIPKTTQYSSSSKKQGNFIPNPRLNERSNYILLTSNDNESSRRNFRCSSTSSINLNENIEESTQNNKNLSDKVAELTALQHICQKLASEIHHGNETSRSISSENSSSKTVRLSI